MDSVVKDDAIAMDAEILHGIIRSARRGGLPIPINSLKTPSPTSCAIPLAKLKRQYLEQFKRLSGPISAYRLFPLLLPFPDFWKLPACRWSGRWLPVGFATFASDDY